MVCVISNAYQTKRSEAQQEKTISLVLYRLDQLEKKVELHNNAVFRLTTLENEVKNIKENISN